MKLDCGCEVWHSALMDTEGIDFCPLHEAAGEMREWIEGVWNNCLAENPATDFYRARGRYLLAATDPIAKAKGEK